MKYHIEKLFKIETNIDDMNPEIYPYLIELLLEKGALDSWLTPIIMKKGRPATCLTLICNQDQKDELIRILFTETTTLGLRVESFERYSLQRELIKVQTEFGEITFKKRYNFENNTFEMKPEVKECIEIAKDRKIPLVKVLSKLTNL